MVERQPSKLHTWVRFPSPAPICPLLPTFRSGLPSLTHHRVLAVPRLCVRNSGKAGFAFRVGCFHDAGVKTGTSAIVDLRSDTVTKPTEAMRDAMARAEVGDDVLGDDPTVKELESVTARLLGKEAALFTTSGTMANQLAIRSQTEPGDEILVEGEAHIYYYEGGGPSALSGVMCRCLKSDRGIFTAAEIEAALRPVDPHFAPTRLVCVENTHNRGGGKVWSIDQVREVAAAARKHGLLLHLDGARLWNASVAAGVSEESYAALFDSVSVCFSKGLGAPVGSALAGSKGLIARARRFRKMMGGGMRQAGIVAAGALFALQHHRERLAEDHENARLLGKGLANLEPLEANPSEVETNMVRFRVKSMTADQFVEKLRARGILVLPVGRDAIRAVTNLMVSSQDIQTALQATADVLK
jgi:threonine aldolase